MCRVLVFLAVLALAQCDLSRYFRPKDDPLATQDMYLTIPENEKAAELSYDNGDVLSKKLQFLRQLEHVTHVVVNLVGFSSDGNGEIDLMTDDFHKYFDAFREHDSVHAIRENRTSAARIPHRRKYLFEVNHADRSLATRIQNAISEALQKSGGSRNSNIPYTVVDDIIREHHQRDDTFHTLYILNPRRPVAPSTNDSNSGTPQEIFYQYSQHESRTEQGMDSVYSNCPTALWVGESRYFWIDITAGPITYGPKSTGDGLVTPLSVPQLSHFYREGKHGFMAQELIAMLCAFVRRSVDHLLNPPLSRFPVPFKNSVLIHVFVMHDGPGSPVTDAFDESDGDKQQKLKPNNNKGDDDDDNNSKDKDEGDGGEDSYDHDNAEHTDMFNIDAIKAQINRLQMAGQSISFARTEVSFGECDLCALAFRQSVRTHSSNVLHSNGLRTQIHPYLDSKELHFWLQHYAREFWEVLPEKEFDGATITIPVFVFSTSSPKLLLLDRFHQAVSFDDMVVAIQTHAGTTVLDLSCNDKPVRFDASDATRAVLGALLQTGWGVAPTHHVWNFGADAASDEYLYSVGLTPFGGLSTHTTLSFAVRDAALRNILYSVANHTLSGLGHVLEHVEAFEKETDELLGEEENSEFVRRWNLYVRKVEAATQALVMHQYNTSLYYFLSADHDVHAMWTMVNTAALSVHSVFSCTESVRPSPWEPLLIALSFAIVLGAWYQQRKASDTVVYSKLD
eukprot:c11771_g1_i1.p1 GENE.c11771_g1_i1~~c11771_g1_i1.p1  ORF type:complete len:735 (-),score=165.05 c11771_g1_i1:88-2292(-)